MKPSSIVVPLLLAFSTWAGWAAAQDKPSTQPSSQKHLTAFASEAELLAYFEPFATERKRQEEARRRQQEARSKSADMAAGLVSQLAAPAAAPAPAAAKAEAAESITNTQVQGVDEGGIVKVHGKHLVILRRGKLFTVNIDRRQLAPIASIDAFGPDTAPGGAWYDEMLISGNTIVVIGYSYSRGGTELGMFEVDGAGALRYRATYNLKSSDYYSSRNYASRLIGSKLVLYTPIPINVHDDPLARLPALRRWQQGATPADFKPIAAPTRIYRTDQPLDPRRGVVLHSVVSCELAGPQPSCQASGVLGAWGRVFHVSQTSVYVWAMQGGAESALFKLPLDGAAPSAIKTQGSPIDQFSFLEQADGRLNVLVRAEGRGDAMWRGERSGGNLALLRLAPAQFGDGQDSAPAQAYRALPAAGEGALQNRFIGGHLLYGAGSGWRRPQQQVNAELQVLDLRRDALATVGLPHGIDRIEALGADAIAVGSDGRDLHFSSVRLDAAPAVAHRYVRPSASQAETRSHGFFYKPDGPEQGLVGLPVRGGGQGGYRQLWDEPAGMLYLRANRLRLEEVGSLAAQPGVGRNDGCRASCMDWYGNARPVFLGGRVFALLGYELVEGKVLAQAGRERMVELRRVSFAPGSPDYQP